MNKQLAEQAAKRLTGRPVIVESRPPSIIGRNGQALNLRGVAVIHVDPGAGDWLHVFCHELAHIRLHFESLPGSDLADLPPQSKTLQGLEILQGTKIHPAIRQQESEADSLAAEWLAFAQKQAPGGSLADQLKALTNYLEPQLQAIVDRAVDRAVKKVLTQHLREIKHD